MSRLVALAAGFVLLAGCITAGTSPSLAPSVAPSTSPPPIPSPTPSATPVSPTPALSGPPISPAPSMGGKPDLRAGDLAMTVTDDLRVRSKPEVNGDSTKHVPTLQWGTRLAIEAGPVPGSGYWWYGVRLVDQTLQGGVTDGWVAAAAKDGTPWVIGGETAILLVLRQRIVGSWAGTVTTEWVGRYDVSLTFRADGTYSSRAELNGEPYPALYWGSDTDSPLKTYSVRDVAADGTASGDIVLYWDISKTTVLDKLGDIAFKGDRLTLSLTHLGQYGPITFDLTRTKAG